MIRGIVDAMPGNRMYELFIANKNYSSWSLRPWVLMRVLDIPFTERVMVFSDDGNWAAFRAFSPTGKVPFLRHGAIGVWDSLAIAEYLAERFPNEHLWPVAREARAIARAATAEMHSGFRALRQAMPMNIRNRFPGKGSTPEVDNDIARIAALWADCRGRFGGTGDFLFGEFCIADAFFAPIVFRFNTYGVRPAGAAGEYLDAMLAAPALQRLAREAADEGHALWIYDDRYRDP